ncbi:MBL fold metallo-hydrolase [candidate division WOR-3 bacterium]|nr:MBL fold metallo-hydrolase [candidate division WOR-3 bacterium]
MSGVMPVSLGMVKVFILAGNRPVLVDTGTRGSARRILSGLERHGMKPEDVGLVLITHTHGDHIGSLAEIKKTIKAPVAVHRLDAGALREGSGVEPDILLEDDFDLRQYGAAGRVIWTPGHSRGSVSVMLESGESVVGDLVLPRFMAFGPPAIAFWSASRVDSIASIRKVLALKPAIVHTSHGGPYRPEDLANLVR